MKRITAVFAILLIARAASAVEPAPPNIVFFLVDDLRYNTLGFMGDKIVQTPNIDRLAARGCVFRNAFVTTSICCVSRASIFSGQWERRHGIRVFRQPFTDAQWNETYLAVLRRAGWRTGFIGKWGVGDQPAQVQAMAARFDFFRGLPGQAGQLFIEPDDPTRKHKTALFGDQAVAFIEQSEVGKPFALQVSFNAVHARDGMPREFEPDPRDEHLYADTNIPLPPTATAADFQRLPGFVKTSEARKRWERRFATADMAQKTLRDYYRLVTGVDREVGRVLDALTRRGVRDNTIIVFFSDNGFALGDRGLADKWFMWEEDIREPMVVFDPRVPEPKRHREVEAMALNVDLAPTMLDLAGLRPPASMQGRSVAPFVRGETPADWRTEFFYEHHTSPKLLPPSEGVRTERWKYIRWLAEDFDRDDKPRAEELYDLQADPLERHNLIADQKHAAIREELRTKWRAYRQRLP